MFVLSGHLLEAVWFVHMLENNEMALRVQLGAGNEAAVLMELSEDQQARRRPLMEACYASLKYVSSLSRKEFRKSDTVSDMLVVTCLVISVLLIMCPAGLLTPQVVISAGSVFLGVISYFIMSRLGILITLSPRQAVLVWDIVVGSLLLGVLFSFYTMYFIVALH